MNSKGPVEINFTIKLSSDGEPVLYSEGSEVTNHIFTVLAEQTVDFNFGIPPGGQEKNLTFDDPAVAWTDPPTPPPSIKVHRADDKSVTIKADNSSPVEADQAASFLLILNDGGKPIPVRIRTDGGTLKMDPTIVEKAPDPPISTSGDARREP